MSRSRVLFVVVLVALILGLAAWLDSGRRGEPVVREAPAPHARAPAVSLAEPPTPAAERTASIPEDPVPTTPAPDLGPLRGHLVDARTGERVPWFELDIRTPDRAETACTSDARGEFVTPLAFGAGWCWLHLVDCLGQPSTSTSATQRVRVEHDPAAAPSAVPIPIGPTYRLRAELPLGYTSDRFRVHLMLDPPEFGEREHAARELTTPLRDTVSWGGLPWARFRDESIPEGAAWLVLASDDGSWSGGARVAGGYGVHEEPVDIVLEPRCSIIGRYVTRDVELDRGGAMLALVRVDGPDEPLWSHATSKAGFRIADLDPGRYRLEVRDEAVRAPPVEFTLTQGELDLGELVWEPIPVAGPVILTVVSAVEVPLDIELVRLFDPPRHGPWHSDQWEEQPDGTFTSVFEWEEVRAGEFEIALHSHDTAPWHVSLGQLKPPVENLVLHLPAPPPTLHLEVRDERTGTEPSDWTVLVRQETGWMEIDGPADAIATAGWDEDAALAVVCSGRRAALLRPAAMRIPSSGEWRVRVDLEEGWSGVFQARKRRGGRPVAGVEIVLDGLRAGATDVSGELWVHRDSAPTTLDVGHAELVLANAETFDPSDPVTWLRMRPR